MRLWAYVLFASWIWSRRIRPGQWFIVYHLNALLHNFLAVLLVLWQGFYLTDMCTHSLYQSGEQLLCCVWGSLEAQMRICVCASQTWCFSNPVIHILDKFSCTAPLTEAFTLQIHFIETKWFVKVHNFGVCECLHNTNVDTFPIFPYFSLASGRFCCVCWRWVLCECNLRYVDHISISHLAFTEANCAGVCVIYSTVQKS